MREPFKRNKNETWRDFVKRRAEKWGMDYECLETYDEEIELGKDEETAAWNALYEWDCLAP